MSNTDSLLVKARATSRHANVAAATSKTDRLAHKGFTLTRCFSHNHLIPQSPSQCRSPLLLSP